MQRLSRSAPAAISARIEATIPCPAATCSGVNAYLSAFASREAPAAISTSTAFVWPCAAARCSMVVPLSPLLYLPIDNGRCSMGKPSPTKASNSAMYGLISWPTAAIPTIHSNASLRVGSSPRDSGASPAITRSRIAPSMAPLRREAATRRLPQPPTR
eukprot:scaffold49816_cov63-Phaeocystis_antarctica.AAC.3